MSLQPPRDALLNEIQEGHWIGLKIGDQLLIGKIKTLSLGGLDVPGTNQKTKGQMMFGCEIPISFESGAVFTNLYRLVDPNQERLMQEVLAKQKGPQLV